MNDFRVPSSLQGRLDRVRDAAARLTLREAVQLSVRLDEARHRLVNLETVTPLVRVLLLGGTGVGKSMLFSALVGREGASPSSDDVRLFTRQPHVAIAHEERALSGVPAELSPQYVDAPWQGIELIDAPDIDGALVEHRALTERLIDACDVIVYVTIPDKRANFDVHEEVRRWGARKRWAFVLNKMDLDASRSEAICADFDHRLRDLGFQPDDETRFLVCARQPQLYDFARLRRALVDPQRGLMAPQYQLDGALGYVVHAVEEPLLAPLADLARQLRSDEQKLLERVKDIYRRALSNPLVEDSFRQAVREQTWGYVGERVGGPMGLAIWLRCRAALLWSVYRLGTGRAFGATQTVWSLLSSAVRGVQPVAQVVAGLDQSLRRELTDIESQVRRTLEDYGLQPLTREEHPASEKSDPEEDATALSPLERAAMAPFKAASRALQRLILGEADARLVEAVRADMQRIARTAARSSANAPTRWLTNLLPVLFLGQVLYRVGLAWWHETYLEGTFFAMALTLFAASLVPGYLLLSLRVRSRAGKPDVNALLAEIDHAPATDPLAHAREQLDALVDEAHQLRRTAQTLRDGLSAELRFVTSRN